MNNSDVDSAIIHLRDDLKPKLNACLENVTFSLIAEEPEEILMADGWNVGWCVKEESVLLEFNVVSVPRTTPRLRRQ